MGGFTAWFFLMAILNGDSQGAWHQIAPAMTDLVRVNRGACVGGHRVDTNEWAFAKAAASRLAPSPSPSHARSHPPTHTTHTTHNHRHAAQATGLPTALHAPFGELAILPSSKTSSPLSLHHHASYSDSLYSTLTPLSTAPQRLPSQHTHTPLHRTTTTHHRHRSLDMSDSSFAAVSRYRGFLEVIDAEWMADALSDDELDVPAATDLFLEDDDDDDGTEGGAPGGGGVAGVGKRPNQEDRWGDLGLEHLQPE